MISSFEGWQHLTLRNLLVGFNLMSCLWRLVTCIVRYLQKSKLTSMTQNVLEKNRTKNVFVKKNTKSRGRHLDFAEYQTKKGKRDNRTLTVGVRQVQKHSYEVRFCPSCLLDTLLRSESEKKSLFLPKWSKLIFCTVRRRRSLQMKMRLVDLGITSRSIKWCRWQVMKIAPLPAYLNIDTWPVREI